jgi:hypothetical protein
MKEKLEELKKIVAEHETRISNLEDLVAGRTMKTEKREQREKKLSIKELLRSKRPKTDVQKVLAIGYYLEKHEGMLSFNVNDVNDGFSSAKEPEPSNTQAFINQNIKNGHIMGIKEKKDKKKAYVLTNSGEEFVENDFNRKEK